MDSFFDWARSIPWFAWIAIIAILSGCAHSIVQLIIRHLERMERIRQGDFPPKD